jgi:glycosyltransferase involved in cell wall biosynthesis
LPDDLVVAIPWIEIALRVLGPLLGTRNRERVLHAGLDLFDRMASTCAVANGARVVVGVENSCLRLFRKSKAAGLLCVLDAASVHYSAQPAPNNVVQLARKAHIDARKDAEIRLADQITVLSSYARETYVAAGVPASKISLLPPGVWRAENPGGPDTRPGTEDGIRFLYVGNVKRAKGIDLLLEAFDKLDVDGKQLAIAGAREEPDLLRGPLPAGVDFLGWLDRDTVFDAYARSDVVVLPSRADGFGFAAAEAMSSGVPVIVSSAVGARDFVEAGVTGWIFESGSAVELERAMREASARRADLAGMGARARMAVADLTWDAYGERIRAYYRGLLERARHAPALNGARRRERLGEHAE